MVTDTALEPATVRVAVADFVGSAWLVAVIVKPPSPLLVVTNPEVEIVAFPF